MIADFDLDALTPGKLGEAFASGARAAVVHDPGRIGGLWQELVSSTPERLPWEETLAELAANHRGTVDLATSLGDMFYFRAGSHGYVARKIEVSREGDALVQRPAHMIADGVQVSLEEGLARKCWDISKRILDSLSPRSSRTPAFTAAIQRIKYQPSPDHLARHVALVLNSLGPQARFGIAIDRERGALTGLLARRGIRDVVARVRAATRGQAEPRANEPAVIERAHIDTRYFSALCGSRDTVQTQLWTGTSWLDLPVSTDRLVVLPGEIARQRLGIAPVLHRVIYAESAPVSTQSPPREHNVTLLLGAK